MRGGYGWGFIRIIWSGKDGAVNQAERQRVIKRALARGTRLHSHLIK
jgi:hypothetical protein